MQCWRHPASDAAVRSCNGAIVITTCGGGQVVEGAQGRPAACYLCKLPDIPGKFQLDKVRRAAPATPAVTLPHLLCPRS